TPELHAAAVDEDAGRFWLFLERVEGVELYQVGELERWQQVLRWLARLHEADLPRHDRLIRYGGDWYRLWFERARRLGHDVPRRGSTSPSAGSAGRATGRRRRSTRATGAGRRTRRPQNSGYDSNALPDRERRRLRPDARGQPRNRARARARHRHEREPDGRLR